MQNNDGWGAYLSTLDGIDFWVEQNECQGSEEIQGPTLNTIHHRYFDCMDNVEVWLYEVSNGGHDWPGVFGNMDINSNIEIWNFLSEHDINGLINCNTNSSIEPANLIYNKVCVKTIDILGRLNTGDSGVFLLYIYAPTHFLLLIIKSIAILFSNKFILSLLFKLPINVSCITLPVLSSA